MNVMDGSYQFLEVFACNFFLESLVWNNEIEQFPSLSELHDKVKVFLGFNNLVQLYDIGVVYLFKDLYLPRNSFNIFFVLYFTLF